MATAVSMEMRVFWDVTPCRATSQRSADFIVRVEK
jgi:hypothetical protein